MDKAVTACGPDGPHQICFFCLHQKNLAFSIVLHFLATSSTAMQAQPFKLLPFVNKIIFLPVIQKDFKPEHKEHRVKNGKEGDYI